MTFTAYLRLIYYEEEMSVRLYASVFALLILKRKIIYGASAFIAKT